MKIPIVSLMALLLFTGSARSHGIPIDVIVEDGKLAPFRFNGKTTFDLGYFDENPLVGAIFADRPGVSVTNAASGVEVDAQLGLDVTSSLGFWNGVVGVTEATLEIVSPDGDNRYVVTSTSNSPNRNSLGHVYR